MKPISIALVGGTRDLRKLIEDSAFMAFGNATTIVGRGLEEVLKYKPPEIIDILVLDDPTPADVIKATQVTDDGFCPWPLIVFGATDTLEGVETVSSIERVPLVVARVLRSAVTEYQLRREIFRARGDLLTVGRRSSHDMRTPLGCIMTTAEALHEVLAETIPSHAPLIQPLLDSAEELMKLIERISFLATASAKPMAKEKVDMRIIVLGALESLEMRRSKRGVPIIQPTTWPEVGAVASWLLVIWGNLLANALKHGGDALRIEVGWDRGDHEHRFWVSDDGSGVPHELQPFLFKSFDTLHEPDARSGLGLAIVKRLVELQNGRCGFEPLSTRGSRFFFTLPDTL